MDANPITSIKLHVKKGNTVYSHSIYGSDKSFISGVNTAPKRLFVVYPKNNTRYIGTVPLTDNFSHPQISPLRVSINGKTYGALQKVTVVAMGYSSDLKATNPVNGNRNLYSYTQKYTVPTNIKRIACYFWWINTDVTKWYAYNGTKLEVVLTMVWDANAKKYTSVSFVVTDNGKNIGSVSGTPVAGGVAYLYVHY